MSIGFKEWALVCDALASGTQSIIIRKGGIAEGLDGFRFKHGEFFLFPTFFHEQLAKTKLPPETPFPARDPGIIAIRSLARVEWTEFVTNLDRVLALAPFHIWKNEVVEERFRYDDAQGVHVAFLRVFRLPQPWTFPDDPNFGGCRSWLELPDAPDTATIPVLDNAAHAAREKEIRRII
jgi:hypothetical protein